MYKSIYNCFKHWFHEDRGTVYFYSDPHFSDSSLYSTYRTGMSDEEQIKRINKVVGKYDTLVILGDVGNPECLKQIKGYKVLIKGNHDSGTTNYIKTLTKVNLYATNEDVELAKRRKEIDCFKLTSFQPPCFTGYKVTGVFDEVYEGALMISDKIVISHEPMNIPNMLNIHGHIHANTTTDSTHLNVCAEHINYTPLRLPDIIKSGALKNIITTHRVTIDKATKRKHNIAEFQHKIKRNN